MTSSNHFDQMDIAASLEDTSDIVGIDLNATNRISPKVPFEKLTSCLHQG
jgi:hypothetical protein